MAVEDALRWRIRVQGTVQGVGFRPFVYGLAVRAGLAGLVGNDADGVFIEVEGPSERLDRFRAALRSEAPPLARIHRVVAAPMAPLGQTGFRIAPSQARRDGRTQVPPDTATCADCLRELADPTDRRYRYPFINCVNCGPRFTIIRDLPYDRPHTTMSGFAMCERCSVEYHDPANRRFHAQPICCPDCGPTLRLRPTVGGDRPDRDRLGGDRLGGDRLDGDRLGGDPLTAAATALRAGKVVAIKGVGGFHLAVSATSVAATARLREHKHRQDKPFAVMVADLVAAARLAQVGPVEAELLTSPARPIVLLPRVFPDPLAPAVAPANPYLGVMLPYTALHVLLLSEFAGPLVLTSANLSDEPIAFRDDDAVDRLSSIVDAIVIHDRPIHVRADDSVVRVSAGRPTMLRRSRGFAPIPITLPRPAHRPILGCGAELKNTFCLATVDQAVLSPHIGDLTDYETYRSYAESIGHFQRLFGITPEVVAHDLHPGYRSSRYALDLAGVETVGIQHHHAHIAACLVDNNETGPVIGVAFDGLGYGTDGTLWGGEFLAADLAHADRIGHLAPVALPGGDAAVRQPWRMAAAYLDEAGLSSHPPLVDPTRWRQVRALARVPDLSPRTSSAGRLFDAVSALVTGRTVVTFEGQAAIELEHLADMGDQVTYQARIHPGPPFQVVAADLVAAAVSDLDSGVSPGRVAMRTHRGVAALIADGCELARDRTGLSTVALSGGVFQNMLLLDLSTAELHHRGFRTLTHHRIAPNDSGISLGQAAIAAARVSIVDSSAP